MPEQSQRDEMNAAIRAQRERQAVPRVISGEAPPPPPVAPPAPVAPEPVEAAAPEPEPVPAPKKSLLSRLFGK
ncbi:MAG: hypothetical protein ABUS54_14155 [Actinomycetota bacterium]